MAKWERPTPVRQVPVHRTRAHGSAPTSPVAEDSAVWPTCKRARTVSRASGRQQGCSDTGTRRGQEPHDDGSGDRRAGTATRCRAMPRRLRGAEGSSAAASPPAEDAHRRRARGVGAGSCRSDRRSRTAPARAVRPSPVRPSAVRPPPRKTVSHHVRRWTRGRDRCGTLWGAGCHILGCRDRAPGAPGAGLLPVSVPGACGDPDAWGPRAGGGWPWTADTVQGHTPGDGGCGPEPLCVTAYSSAYLRIRLRSTYCMMPPLR